MRESLAWRFYVTMARLLMVALTHHERDANSRPNSFISPALTRGSARG